MSHKKNFKGPELAREGLLPTGLPTQSSSKSVAMSLPVTGAPPSPRRGTISTPAASGTTSAGIRWGEETIGDQYKVGGN